MGHSLSAGIAANRDAIGWLVGLADMPAVPKAAIATVRDAIVHGAPLAAPFQEGRRGHPVGFAAAYRDELLALQGDHGARAILLRDSAKIERITIKHPGIFADVDTLADLQLLKAQEDTK